MSCFGNCCDHVTPIARLTRTIIIVVSFSHSSVFIAYLFLDHPFQSPSSFFSRFPSSNSFQAGEGASEGEGEGSVGEGGARCEGEGLVDA